VHPLCPRSPRLDETRLAPAFEPRPCRLRAHVKATANFGRTKQLGERIEVYKEATQVVREVDQRVIEKLRMARAEARYPFDEPRRDTDSRPGYARSSWSS